MEKELFAISRDSQFPRIGTGELSDSLAFDPETRYSQRILSIFEKFPEIVFEFKTKSSNIRNIIDYGKKLNNIVISWSLNPQEVIEREEPGTPNLITRLKAIEAIQQEGFKIGIHFDPLVLFTGWENAYRELVLALSKYVNPARIAWWSLGALRFPVTLREHIFKHPNSQLFQGELIKGHDGKYRYFKPLRRELFRRVIGDIHTYISRDIHLYLCMEDKELWQEIIPHITPEENVVNKYLYDSVIPPA